MDRKNIGIILSGGIGERFGSKYPKQYQEVFGRQIISYSIDAFRQSKLLDDFFVVTDSENNAKMLREKYDVKTIIGGKTRNGSFRNALDYIKNNYRCKSVFVNEAARPLITPKIIDDYLELLESFDCVYCVKSITDSLETKDGGYADRNEYRLVMSPDAYSFEVIDRYFSADSHTTFPGHTIPPSYSRFEYKTYTNNVKLTYPEDLELIKLLLSKDETCYL